MMDDKERELDILCFELEQAREDDRDASNQFWQTVAAGVAAIAFILAFYTELIGGDNRPEIPSIIYVLLISSVSIATFSYATSISMKSAIRYQYIRHLELRIRRLTGVDVIRWKQLISPVETLNIRHITNGASLANYLNVAFAILFSAITCILIIVILCGTLPDQTAIPLGIIVYLPFGALFIYTAWFSSSKSLETFEFAAKQAKRRIEKELIGEKFVPDLKISPWYFLYPRPADSQKALFIPLGMVTYVAFCGAGIVNAVSYILTGVICILVFDVLVYQARYQWNDMRGVVEDEKNPRAENRKRLARTGLPIAHAVLISFVTLLYKLLLAAAIIIYYSRTFGLYLAVCCGFILLVALPYEIAREKNATFFIVATVPLGYVLRFLTGYLTFASMSDNAFITVFAHDKLFIIIMIMASTYFFGLSFVTISWALAGVDWHSVSEGVNPKAHIEAMYNLVGNPGTYSQEEPLNSRGKMYAPWNVGIVASVLILLGAANYWSASTILLTLSVALTLSLIWRITAKRHGGCFLWLVVAILLFCVVVFLRPTILNTYGFNISTKANVCLIIACIYTIIFFMFRKLNYESMLDPFANMRPIIERFLRTTGELIFGEDTFNILCKWKNDDNHE